MRIACETAIVCFATGHFDGRDYTAMITDELRSKTRLRSMRYSRSFGEVIYRRRTKVQDEGEIVHRNSGRQHTAEEPLHHTLMRTAISTSLSDIQCADYYDAVPFRLLISAFTPSGGMFASANHLFAGRLSLYSSGNLTS
jgi:hypothetical protein